MDILVTIVNADGETFLEMSYGGSDREATVDLVLQDVRQALEES